MRVGVVGAGWSGLAAVTFLHERGHDVEVLEAASTPGGRIRTLEDEEGYLVEAGPHAVVSAHEATRRLLELARVPLATAPRGAPRFVVHDGRVLPLPASPPALVRTRLLSPVAKARLLLEPLRARGPPHESVAAFGRRRLGAGASHLVDAFVTGVYAGDPERLALEHAFPELHRMDAEGGLLRGLLARPRAPRPPLVAPEGGMERLVAALASRLRVRYGVEAARVMQTPGGAEVHTQNDKERLRFDRVVLAADPARAARLLGLEAPTPPVAPAHVVAFGVPQDAAPPEGYGVLAPEREARFVLGALYESCLFPHRAPPGHALVRCLVGGRRHPERAMLPEDDVARLAWRDLQDLGVVRGEPVRTFHARTAGIPQPEGGHARWLASLPQGRVRVLGIGHQAVGLDRLAHEAARMADALSGEG